MNRPLVRIAAFLLLALWLPATQHCGLEATGLFSHAMECHETDDCPTSHTQSHCDTDNCQPIEDTAYKSSLSTIQIAAPLALTCLCCLHEITPETIAVQLISPEQTDVPPELAPTWRFVARAAGQPRAPSTVS